jgi:catechol 2,3-dioxygenase-like lactoylglutathione lyase family enzyme
VSIRLDHFIVPCRNQTAAARQRAEILGVAWAEKGAGPFSPVYVNESLTLDFIQTDEAFGIHHYAFHVSDPEFDAIFARIVAAGIPYRSQPHGAMDMKINTGHGGRIVYWEVPDGHYWEMLTRSYARQARG